MDTFQTTNMEDVSVIPVLSILEVPLLDQRLPKFNPETTKMHRTFGATAGRVRTLTDISNHC